MGILPKSFKNKKIKNCYLYVFVILFKSFLFGFVVLDYKSFSEKKIKKSIHFPFQFLTFFYFFLKFFLFLFENLFEFFLLLFFFMLNGSA